MAPGKYDHRDRELRALKLFEVIVSYAVFIGATVASYYIDITMSTLMLMPSVLLMNRVRLLPAILAMAIFFAGSTFLLYTNIDMFFILLMHTLFWMTIQMVRSKG
ncbi:hypothetical protein PoB_001461500 [Plakobranchus ocellatus]|uniref:Uncharacterized protein n=1 Tax=Plakobranchus ocellatus TaxID=259542 RepID=A0AAV3YYX7_9GAST|nr:hypothetical protein PoB_001461500 [Plakobranchus ocellatus]